MKLYAVMELVVPEDKSVIVPAFGYLPVFDSLAQAEKFAAAHDNADIIKLTPDED